jgi:signal transduction histidine kinase
MEERLEALSRRSIELHEEERKRIAREIHDETIQELLFVTNQLQDIVDGVHGRISQNNRERLQKIQGLIDRATVELRGFIQRLRPAVLDDMGLVPALRWLSDKITVDCKLRAQVCVIGQEQLLQPDIQLALFRIAQEALYNVKKHASALNVTLLLQFDIDKVLMSVIDDGKGFQTPAAPNYFTKQGKFGLAGITERVSLLGGNLNVESSPGKGTVVKVEIPRT